MKKAVALLSFAVLFLSLGLAQQTPGKRPSPPSIPVMSVDEVRPGMKGIAYTVFQGTQPEPMEVEILGVLRNVNGPKSNTVLARLRGEKAEYTGVVAGMSGSPVYIDGKLLGAIAFRIGSFSKEAIAGITPITEMLEINEFDRGIPTALPGAAIRPAGAEKTSAPGASGLQNYAQMLQPIDAPFVFSGLTEVAVKAFADKFAAAGIVPVMGIGGAGPDKQPEPVVPGSAVSAILARGDIEAAATCTVTYVDSEHLLACGHPLMQYGLIDMPMTKATVVATLSSPLNSFKIINTTESIGAFVQDRHAGILGRFGHQPEMVPVTLNLNGGGQKREFHFEVLNNAKLTPVMMMVSVFNALQGMNIYGEDTTYRMKGSIQVKGYPEVRLANLFSTGENAPAALALALSLGDHFGRIFDNPLEAAKISGVSLEFNLEKDRRTAVLESVRTDVTEVHPGDEINVEAVLRPYRGERLVRRIRVRVPASAPRGLLRVLVSDAETIERMHRLSPLVSQKLDLRSTIELLNHEHSNDQLYVALLEGNPQATVQEKIMPAMPLSVINIMEGMRASQEMVVFSESAVSESATPVGYAIHGSQVLSLTIK
ncbi:MAG TPA: SpoIVB peptidase S55 domain-containing protein [Candidatus Saccharimonadales bacterium]|jgi:hypothetical protein|nr:SpoIVB peptidase S55 domain-containing protein [Candidatus Saccharimonadales bacterium]